MASESQKPPGGDSASPSSSSAEPVQTPLRTLPPAWGLSGPLSVTALTLEAQRPNAPVRRRRGPRAELSRLEAELVSARESNDSDRERRAAIALCRALAARGAELDSVTRLARRALVLGEDGELRVELSSWFAGIGEPALAAQTLKPLLQRRRGAELGRVLTRIAVLLARAGEGPAATAALSQAAQSIADDPLPHELLGALGAWAGTSLSSERAAKAYLEASQRRLRVGDQAAAFEDLLRAFDMAPERVETALSLAKTLTERGRFGAADEVLRAHASLLDEEEALSAHLQRGQAALQQGESARALAAAFDALLEAPSVQSPSAVHAGPRQLDIDHLLDEFGLHELVAARLEVFASAARGAEAAAAYLELGRLLWGKLRRPLRALRAWVEALIADPTCEPARTVLEKVGAQRPARAKMVRRLLEVAKRSQSSEAEQQQQFSERLEGGAGEHSRESDLELGLLAAATGNHGALADHFLERAAHSDGSDRIRYVIERARALIRQGQAEAALEQLAQLLDDPAAGAELSALALVLAAELHRPVFRARALLSLSPPLPAPLRATVIAVAADHFLEGGQASEALRAAEQACRLDPSLARALAVRGRAMCVSEQVDCGALERAVGVVVPRTAVCAALADAYEAQGEMNLALAWTQRQLALRPGDLAIARRLLERAIDARDASRLGDALGWLLSQPQPLSRLADVIAVAIETLVECERERGAALARRALDVLGPRDDALRESIVIAADRAEEPGLGIAVIERWLASGAPGASRAEVLLDVARRRRKAGDADGAARALLRCLREGGDSTLVREEVSEALEPRGSDGFLALEEARAESLSGSSSAELSKISRAWREVGAARWDLAQDTAGAILAWERAAHLDPEAGWSAFAADLVAFAGADTALTHLLRVAGGIEDTKQRARALSVAASVALEAGKLSDALTVAAEALLLDPSRADVLAVAERSARSEQVPELDRVYDCLANAALGNFTERAVHYRAARQMEQRGQVGRALTHAARAFEAVPSEGAPFVMMARLSERAGRTEEAVAAIERVAGRVKTAAERSEWLKRAALFADGSPAGMRQRLEMLLRALSVRPDAETMRALGEAFRAALEATPEDREILSLRFSRALGRMLERVEGPEGAYLAVLGAELSVSLFADVSLAYQALGVAVERDASLEQYALMKPLVDRLTADRGAAERLVESVRRLHETRLSNVGRGLLEVAAMLADELGDDSATPLYVAAACSDPDDRQLVRRAEELALRSGDKDLLERVLEAVPAAERVEGLLEISVQCERGGQLNSALGAVRRARAIVGLSDDERERLDERLTELLRATGRSTDLEALLSERRSAPGLDPMRRAAFDVELSALYAARGNVQQALAAVATSARELRTSSLLEDMAGYARQAGDQQAQVEALEMMLDAGHEPHNRESQLRELAFLLSALGDKAAAVSRFKEVLEQNPRDGDALRALEVDAEERADYETLLQILARRAEIAARPDEVRRIHLRRAMVLDQRLARPEEAISELERLLQAMGEHNSVLRVMADLTERVGNLPRAAQLWLRASQNTADRAEATDLSMRACRAQLSAGELGPARRTLDELPDQLSEDVLSLRVELERRSEDPVALGEALEALALNSSAEIEERAGWLLEAASAAEAAGNDQLGLERAERACDLVPDNVHAQLTKHTLLFRKRGVGTEEDALTAISELGGLSNELSAEQVELSGYLLAEARDRAYGEGAGDAELQERLGEAGPRPLLALSLARRAVRAGDPARALNFFERAIGGDLRRLESAGQVRLAAARAALSVGAKEQAQAYLEGAEADPETMDEVKALQEELNKPSELPPGEAEVEAPMDTRRSSAPVPGPLKEPEVSVRRGDNSALQLKETLSSASDHAEVALSMREVAESPSSRDGSAEEVPGPVSKGSSAPPPSEGPLLEVKSGIEPPLSETLPAKEARVSPLGPVISDQEAQLSRALDAGDADAGRLLVDALDGLPERTSDFVFACQRLVRLVPGEPEALASLHKALERDGAYNYARAIAHVRGLLGDHEPVSTAPLSAQDDQPDAVRALLFRDVSTPGTEALGIVWEGAQHVFRRDPSTYGVTGLERIPLGAPTPLGQAYSESARALGLTRTPMFQRRTAGQMTVGVALLAPPAIIVSGEVLEDTPELRLQVGSMLAATLPQHILLFGTDESQGTTVLEALALAFGPPQKGARNLAAATLAEVLWESIPARAQRRLREICDTGAALDYAKILASARQVLRRAALFLTGDLGLTLNHVLTQEGREPPPNFHHLSELAQNNDSIADLVRLATSPEYAQVRWQAASERLKSGTSLRPLEP